LNAAIAPRKIRLEAVAFALEFFNHQDVDAHDEELALGAANVLLSKLAYAFSVHPLDDEVYQIATSMSLILGGASRSAVTKAFDEAGKSVIPLIVDMIRPPLNCHPLAVNRMISVLRYFSRALTAMVPSESQVNKKQAQRMDKQNIILTFFVSLFFPRSGPLTRFVGCSNFSYSTTPNQR